MPGLPALCCVTRDSDYMNCAWVRVMCYPWPGIATGASNLALTCSTPLFWLYCQHHQARPRLCGRLCASDRTLGVGLGCAGRPETHGVRLLSCWQLRLWRVGLCDATGLCTAIGTCSVTTALRQPWPPRDQSQGGKILRLVPPCCTL